MKTGTKIGVMAFAFAMMFGLSVSDTYAFGGEKGQRGDRSERTEKRGERHKNISEEGKEFRAEQRAEFEDFLGLDEGELKELKEAGEKLSDILDDQNIDEDDMKEFLEDQAEETIEFITDERDLNDEQVEKLEERWYNKIARKLARLFN